jgi:uncharacterized protein YndB with AHSA1/START domain
MEPITVDVTINEPVERVWEVFTEPEYIKKWGHASDDWHTPTVVNYLRVGGSFNFRMEARDGSEGFDFTGTYTEVVPNKRIAYTMSDGRKVAVDFEEMGNSTHVKEVFDPENENPIEVQRKGWQSILDNFKKHAESH